MYQEERGEINFGVATQNDTTLFFFHKKQKNKTKPRNEVDLNVTIYKSLQNKPVSETTNL